MMPKSTAAHIPIQLSLELLRSIEYEVGDDNPISKMGEKRCVTWTEHVTVARKINLQVADVHNALLSLSQCAGMRFESRSGRLAGALIDEETGEAVPFQRKGNFVCKSIGSFANVRPVAGTFVFALSNDATLRHTAGTLLFARPAL